MNYSKIYKNLIERSFGRELDCYVEKHHITPKCMGGGNEKSNMAILTPEEHYLAHLLLVKIYPDNHKLVYACNAMGMCNNGKRPNIKRYGWLKRKHSKAISEFQSGDNHYMYGRFGVESPTAKPVNQYSKSGEFIKTWDSMMDAYRDLKISHQNISECCSKKLKSAGGFLWRFIDDTNVSPFINKRIKSINQYSKSGEFIKSWNSMVDAQDELKIHAASISVCCIGKSQSAGGFLWRFADDNDVSPFINKSVKPVNQFTKSGDFVKTWDSMMDAYRDIGIHFGGISNCCLGKTKTAGGFRWEYKQTTDYNQQQH